MRWPQGVRWPWIAGALAAVALAVVAVVMVVSGEETIDPFGYARDREGDLERRAAAGESHLVYENSPGGAPATARRVARLRRLVESAAAAGRVDPDVVEAMVYLESGGLADAIAGNDLGGAVGVAQILPETARGLLGMRVDVAASRRLTGQIRAARRRGDDAAAARLSARRRRVDQRFDPARSLAGMGRYLAFARPRFVRPDLTAVSYHMGIGNLAEVIRDYAGPGEQRLAREIVRERDLSYAQLYFDSGPFRHKTAYRRLQALGDDSSTYYWRVLAARRIMRMHRRDPASLARLARTETAYGSAEAVIRLPGRTPVFPDQAAVRRAREDDELRAVPNDPGSHHFGLDPAMGRLARQFGRDPELYASLRPEALATLEYIAERVHRIGKAKAPLVIAAAVQDAAYHRALVQRRLAAPPGYTATTTGYSFDVQRRYASRAQAEAFQAVLDRLQVLDVIAWERRPAVIHVTVSDRARDLLPLLDGARISSRSSV
jgi:soluble lytic murein transglycosylase-like protein